MVHGGMSDRRGQYVVSHIETSCVQTQGNAANTYADGSHLGFLLHFVDHHQMLHISSNLIHLFANGQVESVGDTRFLALANAFHSGSLFPLYPQSKVVV